MIPFGYLAGGVFVLGGVVAWALQRVIRSGKVAVGQPTATEAKIEAKTQQTAGDIAKDGEKKQAEVAHASRDDLLSKFRDELRGGK